MDTLSSVNARNLPTEPWWDDLDAAVLAWLEAKSAIGPHEIGRDLGLPNRLQPRLSAESASWRKRRYAPPKSTLSDKTGAGTPLFRKRSLGRLDRDRGWLSS